MDKPEKPDSVKKPESVQKLKEKIKPSPNPNYWYKQFTRSN